MRKRLLSAMLVFVMLLSLLPGTALADNDEVTYPVTGGNIYFDKTTGTIIDCDDSVTEVVIPSKIDGVATTTIGPLAFWSCTDLVNIVIPG